MHTIGLEILMWLYIRFNVAVQLTSKVLKILSSYQLQFFLHQIDSS
jgi:hypothetical protein